MMAQGLEYNIVSLLVISKFLSPTFCEIIFEETEFFKNKTFFRHLYISMTSISQVRLFEFSDGKAIWKRGSRLKKNGHLAIVRQEE